MKNLARPILKGDMRAAARLLTMIERGEPQARSALKTLYPHTGQGHVVGITGPTGAGKSTLIDGLIGLLRKKKERVGVLAVDPSSPVTGGAILGDRIRMRSHLTDPGVFIRSLASRGRHGGLPLLTIMQATHVLNALGLDTIFVETLGVGQDQVAVRSVAHTVVVLITPGMGDEVQTLKAGFLEITDLYVVNKADLPGAEAIVQQLAELSAQGGKEQPVLKVSALRREGLKDLLRQLSYRKRQLAVDKGRLGSSLTQSITRQELLVLLEEALTDKALASLPEGRLDQISRAVAKRRLDPYTAVQCLLKQIFPSSGTIGRGHS